MRAAGAAVAAWCAGTLADRFGRVRTMQVAAAVLAIGALGSGLVATNAYVVFFGVSWGWGPVVRVLLGGMFPHSIRAIVRAVAVAVAVAVAQRLANFAITSSFPVLAELGLSFACGVYAAFALLSLLLAVRAVRGAQDARRGAGEHARS